MRETIDIPLSALNQLDLHDGEKVVGELHGNVVRFTVVKVEQHEQKKNAAKAFLEKWSGVLNAKSISKEDYANDPRMLHYIDKYQLDQ